MANSFIYKSKSFSIGSTVNVTYKFKEGQKEHKQIFKGILMKIKGSTPYTKMFTLRKVSNSGIGVERIIPLASPFLDDIKLVKKSSYTKAKANFIRGLSQQELRHKLYRTKK